MRHLLKFIIGLAASATTFAAPPATAADAGKLDWHSVPLPAIDGGALPAELFAGKAVLVVNTASNCGFTKQYQGLQKLWLDHRDRGLVVLGVPSNDFGGQEPGRNDQIQQFCQVNYGVDFPLLEKQKVVGADAHPIYRWAAAQVGEPGLPHWNFHKYLIGRDGRLLDWFVGITAPDSQRLLRAVDAALAEKQP